MVVEAEFRYASTDVGNLGLELCHFLNLTTKPPFHQFNQAGFASPVELFFPPTP
jgi:hypothetical protein